MLVDGVWVDINKHEKATMRCIEEQIKFDAAWIVKQYTFTVSRRESHSESCFFKFANTYIQSAANILKKYLDPKYNHARIGRVCFQLVDEIGIVGSLYSNSFKLCNKYVPSLFRLVF